MPPRTSNPTTGSSRGSVGTVHLACESRSHLALPALTRENPCSLTTMNEMGELSNNNVDFGVMRCVPSFRDSSEFPFWGSSSCRLTCKPDTNIRYFEFAAVITALYQFGTLHPADLDNRESMKEKLQQAKIDQHLVSRHALIFSRSVTNRNQVRPQIGQLGRTQTERAMQCYQTS